MKLRKYFFLFILVIIINQTNQQYLSLTSHSTNKYLLKTGSWKDLLGVVVACPNGGILKNFVLKKDSTYFWYEYQCYSSDPNDQNPGEAIIKSVTLTSTHRYTINIQENIRTLSDYPVECWVDYGLISFTMYDNSGVLTRQTICHGLKSSYSTKIEIKTATVTALATKIDGLVGITVGSTAKEDNVNVAYALRGFKYIVDVSSSNEKPKVSYVYAYSILRNMKIVKENAEATFERLRNSNTQKN